MISAGPRSQRLVRRAQRVVPTLALAGLACVARQAVASASVPEATSARSPGGGQTAAAAAAEQPMPRYDHIFLIIAENKSYEVILGEHSAAPHLKALARRYGVADRFYAEVHPSEANYVAMLGGSTFGIHDDDAYYCRPGQQDTWCPRSTRPDYVDHTIDARSLVEQLESRGLTWKAYMEDLPEAGSGVVRWPTADHGVPGLPNALYAVKHNGFMNFRAVQDSPARRARIVDFHELERDLAVGTLPNYAHIVPNQCNDMHGRSGDSVPADCTKDNPVGLIARGDRVIGGLVDRIMQSPAWSAHGNFAIVVTFDENDKSERGAGEQGCCGSEPDSAANFGGGRIATIVITNHGPRALVDPRPYNHYSLLRSTEQAFGIDEYLAHAADVGAGVLAMTPLFAVGR